MLCVVKFVIVILLLSINTSLASITDDLHIPDNITPATPFKIPDKMVFSAGNCANLPQALNRCQPLSCNMQLTIGDYKYQITNQIKGYLNNLCYFERTFKTRLERNQPFQFTVSCKLDDYVRGEFYKELSDLNAGKYKSLLSLDRSIANSACTIKKNEKMPNIDLKTQNSEQGAR